MKFLITGTASGLGKHLLETLGGATWDRRQSTSVESKPDVIIHSAWPARPPQTNEGLPDYRQSTLELTRRLTEWPHQKFIFISTAEVYPQSGHSGSEDQPIDIAAVRNFYAHCKLLTESIVTSQARNVLILRVVGLLGPTARPSSLIRILRGDPEPLTLTAESRFYYILHPDVSALISQAIQQDWKGIYNVCSSQSVTLGEVAAKFDRNVRWGNFTYDVGHVENGKVAAAFPAFKKTSLEIVEEYWQKYGLNR